MASKKSKKKNTQLKPDTTNKVTTSKATRSMQILFIIFSVLIVLSMLLSAAAKF